MQIVDVNRLGVRDLKFQNTASDQRGDPHTIKWVEQGPIEADNGPTGPTRVDAFKQGCVTVASDDLSSRRKIDRARERWMYDRYVRICNVKAIFISCSASR